MMVANEGLGRQRLLKPGPPGLAALHPLQRMLYELLQVKKRLQEYTYRVPLLASE